MMPRFVISLLRRLKNCRFFVSEVSTPSFATSVGCVSRRKRIVTAEYSVENDLDVHKLSAQLSVISKDNIKSIGDLQGRIAKLRSDYETQRIAINNLINEYNNSLADSKKAESLYKRIAAQKEKLLQIRQRYDVYCDISKTYGEISKGDYISNLVEERKRQEQVKKKKQHR